MQLETFGSFTTYRANKSICCRKNRIIKNEVKFPAFPLQITQALEVPPLPFLLIWRLAGTSMLPHQIGFENIAVMLMVIKQANSCFCLFANKLSCSFSNCCCEIQSINEEIDPLALFCKKSTKCKNIF